MNAIRAQQPRPQVSRAARIAQALPLSPADRAALSAVLEVARKAEAAGLDVAEAAALAARSLTAGTRNAVAQAHVDDVIATALQALRGAEKAFAAAALALSPATREKARAVARQVQAALRPAEPQAPALPQEAARDA